MNLKREIVVGVVVAVVTAVLMWLFNRGKVEVADLLNESLYDEIVTRLKNEEAFSERVTRKLDEKHRAVLDELMKDVGAAEQRVNERIAALQSSMEDDAKLTLREDGVLVFGAPVVLHKDTTVAGKNIAADLGRLEGTVQGLARFRDENFRIANGVLEVVKPLRPKGHIFMPSESPGRLRFYQYDTRGNAIEFVSFGSDWEIVTTKSGGSQLNGLTIRSVFNRHTPEPPE